jgi:hypothetical protein
MTEVEELYRVTGRKAGRVGQSGTKKRKKRSGPSWLQKVSGYGVDREGK